MDRYAKAPLHHTYRKLLYPLQGLLQRALFLSSPNKTSQIFIPHHSTHLSTIDKKANPM